MARKGDKKAPKKAAEIAKFSRGSETKWTDEPDVKIRLFGRRRLRDIRAGWLSHIPHLDESYKPPTTLNDLTSINEIIPRILPTGELLEVMSGARPTVLHQSIHLAHKAVHVHSCVADLLASKRHTWAMVDAYQGALFALMSINAFFGLSEIRDASQHILMDVWARDRRDHTTKEIYKLVRFKEIGHFHKWALLKRLIDQLEYDDTFCSFVSNCVRSVEDKKFARHRNWVFYYAEHWTGDDLLESNEMGFFPPAASTQDLFNEIANETAVGSIYLMVLLVEFACYLLGSIDSALVTDQVKILNRREAKNGLYVQFDWNELKSS